MLHLLRPCRQVGSVLEIDLEELRELGIQGILLDLDNTLLAWDNLVLSDEVQNWVRHAIEEGFQLCIVSNAHWMRLETQSVVLGIPYVADAMKPSTRAMRKALDLMGLRSHQAAMVGDQIFTDILGGNRLGLFTILVVPMYLKEQWWMKGVRWMETRVVRVLRGRGRRIWRGRELKSKAHKN
jgi:hypothetical protein